MVTHNILLLQLIFSLFVLHHINMVWLFFPSKLCSSMLLTCFVLFLVWFLCHRLYHCNFKSYKNLSSSLWDGVYFFVLHCPCRLTMFKIEACRFCWVFQFASSCYSDNNGSCHLYSMVKVLWIGWLLVSWISFWCLHLRLAKVLVF